MGSLDPLRVLSSGWTLGESGWKDGTDANLRRLGAVVGFSVQERDPGTPLASAVDGDRCRIPAGAAAPGQGAAGRSRCASPVAGSITCPVSAGSVSSRARACFRPTRTLAGAPGSRSEPCGRIKALLVCLPAACEAPLRPKGLCQTPSKLGLRGIRIPHQHIPPSS